MQCVIFPRRGACGAPGNWHPHPLLSVCVSIITSVRGPALSATSSSSSVSLIYTSRPSSAFSGILLLLFAALWLPVGPAGLLGYRSVHLHGDAVTAMLPGCSHQQDKFGPTWGHRNLRRDLLAEQAGTSHRRGSKTPAKPMRGNEGAKKPFTHHKSGETSC